MNTAEYSGIEEHNPGSTFPNGPINNSGYYFHQSDGLVGAGFFSTTKHIIIFGAPGNVGASGAPYLPILTPAEAKNVDLNYDDGKPHSGATRIRAWDGRTCSQGAFLFPNNTTQINTIRTILLHVFVS